MRWSALVWRIAAAPFLAWPRLRILPKLTLRVRVALFIDSGPILADPGSSSSTPGQSWSDVVEPKPIVVDSGPRAAESGPKLPQIAASVGRTRAKFGRCWTSSAPRLTIGAADSGRNSAHHRSTPPKCSRFRADDDFVPHLDTINPNSTKFGCLWLLFNQTGPGLRSTLGRFRPDAARLPEIVSATSPRGGNFSTPPLCATQWRSILLHGLQDAPPRAPERSNAARAAGRHFARARRPQGGKSVGPASTSAPLIREGRRLESDAVGGGKWSRVLGVRARARSSQG